MNRGLGDTNREGERRHGHVHDLLYAYIDGSLNKQDQEAVRRHLQTCPDCRGDFIELKAARKLLKSLPMVPPPRAFTLTPEMVREIKPQPGFWERFFVPRNAPRFAFGSVLSLVIMMLVLFAGPLGREVDRTVLSTASAPQAGMSSADTPPSLYSKQAAAPTASTAAAASSNSALMPTTPPAPAGGGAGGSSSLPAGTPPAQDQTQPASGAASGGVGAAAAEATASPAAAAAASATESHVESVPQGVAPTAPAKVMAPTAPTSAPGELSTAPMDNPTTTALNPGQPAEANRNSATAPSQAGSSNSGTLLVSLGVGLGVLSALLAVFAVISSRKRV